MERLGDESRELQCVGRLEIIRPKQVGFLCGSIPVSIDDSLPLFSSDFLRSKKVRAPWYRMLLSETGRDKLPLISNFTEKLLPVGASVKPNAATAEGGAFTSIMTRKCEELAVTGLVDYEDEIDVIAPADILKQIFKMPYSKSRLSIAVRRIGKTLILNAGPDGEKGEKLNGRYSNFSKCADESSFGNVPVQSVRVEACDCPPGLNVSVNPQSSSPVVTGGQVQTNKNSECSQDLSTGNDFQFYSSSNEFLQTEALSHCSEYSHAKEDNIHWKTKKKKGDEGYVTKSSSFGDKTRHSVKESDRYKKVGTDEFRRVLFWQFCNFRMLLGSDLLLFSNDKFVAVSLHLCEISQKENSLTWLDFWLDNVMASVPELAICYHENGVVKGYDLLKTDDIFLLRGISEDGTPAFHPHVVQQNGLAVLRFLQENCKQDPGAYWLYKMGGEDGIRIFDLSVIPPNDCGDVVVDSSTALPSIHRGRSDSLFALGTLLYRVAHRFSLLRDPDRSKCAKFFKKCLDFLYEPDHMVVRASAHEQFARLLLNYEAELDSSSESEVLDSEAKEVSVDLLNSSSEPSFCKDESASFENHFEKLTPNVSLELTLDDSQRSISSHEMDSRHISRVPSSSNSDEASTLSDVTQRPAQVVKTNYDPISSKLAAIHHVQQAIKSLRVMREHGSTKNEPVNHSTVGCDKPVPFTYSVCACGDTDCIEVCDIQAWLPTSKLDHKLWKLVLLLGESYLALGQAYKEDGQLNQALKIVGVACSLYGSMPKQLGDTTFISSLTSAYSFETTTKVKDENAPIRAAPQNIRVTSAGKHDSHTAHQFSSSHLFWAKTWMLVGDIFVEFHIITGKDSPRKSERKHVRELRMSSEVMNEVQRLKQKVGQFNQSCSSCSLVNCSCQSDRASSGISATSSSTNPQTSGHGKKHHKKFYGKGLSHSSKHPETNHVRGAIGGKKKSDFEEPISGCLVGDLSKNTSSIDNERVKDIFMETMSGKSEATSTKTDELKIGGIFKYLGDTFFQDGDDYLTAAFDCFVEAKRALTGISCDSTIMQALIKKKGWVSNELGRYWLDRKELDKAEVAFADAIASFKEAADHTNIILINLNLGHGRRALAEETVSKMEVLRIYPLLQNACTQSLNIAKQQYNKSLKYYRDAKVELDFMGVEAGDVFYSLRNEVYTQFANTYLRLGMLLAKEQLTSEVLENGSLEDAYKMDNNTSKWTANEALRKALSLYELLGDLRKQETAYTYYQIACYQRDCCLKFLASDNDALNFSKGESSNLARAKIYISLAERNWQHALDFYGPNSHTAMYLAILIERSALLLSFTGSFRSHTMLETALSCLLGGRHITEEPASSDLKNDNPDLCNKYWSQLQVVLKKMLGTALSVSGKKSVTHPASDSNKSKEVAKLKELYKMALKSTDFGQLRSMHELWTS